MHLARLALPVIAVATHAMAYPILPETIWSLTETATVVVVARVTEVEPRSATDDDWRDSTAVLDVIEVLRGTTEKTIRVPYEARLSCPAPAGYFVGRNVIAFLRRDHEAGEYSTVALSYGTRYADTDAEFATLRSVVAQAIEAHSSEDVSVRRRWVREAFKHRITRWDALFVLAPEIDRLRLMYGYLSAPTGLFSEDDLQELEASFMAEPSFDDTFVQSMLLLDGHRSSRFTNLTIDVIESIMNTSDRPFWIDVALSLLEARLELRRFTPRGEQRISARDGSAEQARVDARWRALKKRFRLEPHPREDFTTPLRTGTGGQTPP